MEIGECLNTLTVYWLKLETIPRNFRLFTFKSLDIHFRFYFVEILAFEFYVTVGITL